MKKIILILTFMSLISLSFSSLIFNQVLTTDLGQNGNDILQISSSNGNLYFLTNNSINLYNFQYTKTYNIDTPISMKIYDNIYVQAKNALYIYNKDLKLLKIFKAHFFNFDYDTDTKTLILFNPNSVKVFSNFKLFKTFTFSQSYDYFSYDSFNKKILLAKKDGEFLIIDQILFTVNKYTFHNYNFKEITSHGGNFYFLDDKGLFSFDYLVFKKLPLNPLWMINKNNHLFLIFDDFVMDYDSNKKYKTTSIVKDLTLIDSMVYLLYQNNFIFNSNGKIYYFINNFNGLFYDNGLVLYDSNRGLFKTEHKTKYVNFHFNYISYDNFKHYVVGFDENYIYFLDSDFSLLKKIKLAFIPVSMIIDEYNSVLFIKSSDGKVYSMSYSQDGFSNFVIADRTKVFMSKYFEYYSINNHSIDIIDSYNKVISTFKTNSIISGAVFSDYFNALFFITSDGNLYEYDLISNSVIKVQKVSQNAFVIISVKDSIYVLDSNNQKLIKIYYKK